MKIGITLDLTKAFWSNGLQQNIVFLYSLLRRGEGNECYYITNESQTQTLKKSHDAIILEELLADESFVLDVLLVAGFDLLPEMYPRLLQRNPHLKIILIHYGNKLMDDIHYGVCSHPSSRIPLVPPTQLSGIWISPHHQFAVEYLKTYYRCPNVHVAPYIWDSFFLEEHLPELQAKGLSPLFRAEDVRKVCIFEPNISHIKNCLPPLALCSRIQQEYPGLLERISVAGCENLRDRHYFNLLLRRFGFFNELSSLSFFNNRWGTLTALSKWGSTIISHQHYNALNYLYFEALYLNLPLIHNSPMLSDVGYYYPEYDLKMGANQFKSAALNHASTLDSYRGDVQRFLYRHSPYHANNLAGYMNLLNNDDKPQT